MSSRPKRQRKAPERFRSYVTDPGDLEIADANLEAQAPPQRASKRTKPAVKKEDATLEATWPLPGAVKVEEPAPKAPPPRRSPSPAAWAALPPRPGPGARITVTRAKDVYRLTDGDLRGLPCQQTENPHGASFAPMRLYHEREVYDLSVAKWGSPAAVAAAREASHARGEAMAAARERNARESMERKTEVACALLAAGVHPMVAARLAHPDLEAYRQRGTRAARLGTAVAEAAAAYAARLGALQAALEELGFSKDDADMPLFNDFLAEGDIADAAATAADYAGIVSHQGDNDGDG